jgi:hypothetical protein
MEESSLSGGHLRSNGASTKEELKLHFENFLKASSADELFLSEVENLPSELASSIDSSSSSGQYVQFIGRKKSNCDGDSEVVFGSSVILNSCFFGGEYNSNGETVPYYYRLSEDAKLPTYFNKTYSLSSDCSTTLKSSLLPYPQGCSKVSGNSYIKSLDAKIVSTVYWPTGSSYVIQ